MVVITDSLLLPKQPIYSPSLMQVNKINRSSVINSQRLCWEGQDGSIFMLGIFSCIVHEPLQRREMFSQAHAQQ